MKGFSRKEMSALGQKRTLGRERGMYALPLRAADDGLKSVSEASSAVRTKLNQPDVRDNFLLGVAGAAVAADLGIAYQRRNTWY